MSPVRGFAAFVVAFGLASAAQSATLSVKDEMKQLVEPVSNLLFAVGGEVDPGNGPDAAKVTDARWAQAAAAAAQLQAVAAGLMLPDRAADTGPWVDYARQMADTAQAANKAAVARDGAALSQAANDLSDACAACHAKYKRQT